MLTRNHVAAGILVDNVTELFLSPKMDRKNTLQFGC